MVGESFLHIVRLSGVIVKVDQKEKDGYTSQTLGGGSQPKRNRVKTTVKEENNLKVCRGPLNSIEKLVLKKTR